MDTTPDHFTVPQQVLFRASEQHPPALNALVALKDESTPQLALAGVDTQEASARVRDLQQRIREELRAKKISVALQEANNPFADVPFTSPVWKQVRTLMEDGLVVGYTADGTYGGTVPITRFQFGLPMGRLLVLLPGVVEHPPPADSLCQFQYGVR